MVRNYQGLPFYYNCINWTDVFVILSLDDGDEDIIVCNNFGEPFFYQNLQMEPNNWIRIRVMHR